MDFKNHMEREIFDTLPISENTSTEYKILLTSQLENSSMCVCVCVCVGLNKYIFIITDMYNKSHIFYVFISKCYGLPK
jgi:hypothetical protein